MSESDKSADTDTAVSETGSAGASSGAASQQESSAPTSKSTVTFIVFALVAIGVGWWYMQNQGKEKTDDAYVHGHKHMVSSRIVGRVVEVLVDDNQMVKKGDVLVRLDTERYQRVFEAAQATLAQAKAARDEAKLGLEILKVTTVDDISSAEAQLASSNSQLESTEATLAFFEFRNQMADKSKQENPGSVSEFYLKERDKEVKTGAASLAQAQSMISLHEAQLNSAKTGPQQVAKAEATLLRTEAAVLAAEAALKQAELSLKYCDVVAPADGQVVKKSVEVGHQVAVGTPLLAVVDLETTWIIANFKETQMGEMKVGQDAEITVDTYGTTLTGKIESFDGGTGAAFGLFPPQNATGNFVKITQRIPIKITFADDQRDPDRPLRIGMSCNVTVMLDDSASASAE